MSQALSIVHRRTRFPALVANTPDMEEFVADAATEAGLDPSRLLHLRLAIAEAVTNICLYAYPGDDGWVDITVSSTADTLTVTICDGGRPYDPLQHADPDIHASLEDRPLGGLGIFLMRRVTDALEYQRVNECNVLTMTLYAERVES